MVVGMRSMRSVLPSMTRPAVQSLPGGVAGGGAGGGADASTEVGTEVGQR